MPPIKILGSGLPVIGRVQIGESGPSRKGAQKGPPRKFDHCEFRSTEKDLEGNFLFDLETTMAVLETGAKTCGGCKRSEQLAKQYGAAAYKDGLPVELEIGLPYDDLELNFPHRLAYFMYELAAAFHTLWTKGRDEPGLRFIIEEDRALTTARLAMVRGLQLVIASGLTIFGVSPVEEMR